MKAAALSMAWVGLLAASSARATVDEPNGQQVPIDSSPEVQLYTLFQQRGDPIDWQADAHDTPNAFTPTCGFTATFVLNQAGSHFGLGWYNETGTAPTQIFPLVAANSPVGTMFTGASIRNSPNYMGGTVGFALVGGQTHYTNKNYDVHCHGPPVCSTAAPWILALIYPSKITPSAYYIAFEDGSTTPFDFSNDGDFNDDVYFVTGINCQGGGMPCNTGKQGICAAGITQCTATGTECVPLSMPQMETCNGLDDDCNGQVDDGDNLCKTGYVCDKGTCVMACGSGEFTCPNGLACDGGYCVDPACKGVTCPAGEVCKQGTCKGPCDGVTCPMGQVCRVGACVDPCAGVMCGAERVCENGVCVGSCTCEPCTGGKKCDTSSGECLDAGCIGKTCPAGNLCVQGQCVDACQGAQCPEGQTCKTGMCVASAGEGGAGATSSAEFAATGTGTATGGANGQGGASGSGANGKGHSKGNGGDGFGPGADNNASSGCSCKVGDTEGGSQGWVWAGVLFMGGWLAAKRRRA